MHSKELTVVIVTFKSENKIFDCLDSIANNLPVIIIENSSNKNLKRILENKYKNVKCILTGENIGYAAANNIGLKQVKTKYALILNPDSILEKNAVKNFLSTSKKIQDFWMIGPATDQKVKLDFSNGDIIQVDNLKGFAIFFNLVKFNYEFFDDNFFLYFEEIDLCKRVKNSDGKIYIDKNIIIKHEGASSVENNKEIELEKNRNWHWMWSTFYFHKKYKGYLLALVIISPKLFSSIFKTFLYMLILNKKKRDIYFCRLSGIVNSMIGKKSWFRPSLD